MELLTASAKRNKEDYMVSWIQIRQYVLEC